jgi:hypothetical protein
MDETYVGGKPQASAPAKWQHPTKPVQSQAVSWAHDKKTPVFSMVERNRKMYVDGKAKPVVGSALRLCGSGCRLREIALDRQPDGLSDRALVSFGFFFQAFVEVRGKSHHHLFRHLACHL